MRETRHPRAARFMAFLKRPLFGTRVVPRGARVDPKSFSEDEFPIWCPDCDYLLRGLPDGRCPECGAPFERGLLLVRQYVHNPLGRFWRRSRSGRIFLVVAGLGAVLPFVLNLLGLAGWLLWMTNLSRAKQAPPRASAAIPNALSIFSFVVQVLSLCALVWIAWHQVGYWREVRRKRTRIMEAIPESREDRS